jgi:hypothetical protein
MLLRLKVGKYEQVVELDANAITFKQWCKWLKAKQTAVLDDATDNRELLIEILAIFLPEEFIAHLSLEDVVHAVNVIDNVLTEYRPAERMSTQTDTEKLDKARLTKELGEARHDLRVIQAVARMREVQESTIKRNIRKCKTHSCKDLLERSQGNSVLLEQFAKQYEKDYKTLEKATASKSLGRFKFKGDTYVVPTGTLKAILSASLDAPEDVINPNIKLWQFCEVQEFMRIADLHKKNTSDRAKHIDIDYTTAIQQCAVLCRKVVSSTGGILELEKFPIRQAEQQQLISQRTLLFEDLPLSIVQDVSFFLLSTLNDLVQTRLTNTFGSLNPR